ncbi:MAG: RIP metalloprotease RseP [Burkholderiaceae bacterium]
MSIVWTIAAFLLALGPLIVFHELGHYSVARLCGVKVLRFSVGFGRPLLKWVRGRDRTEWVLSAIPFGGYVAMLDERETHGEPIPAADLPRAFNRQHVAKRIAIVIAGPLANLLLAVLLYAGINMFGVDEPRALFAAPDAGSSVAESGIAAPFEVTALDGVPMRSMVDLRWRLLKSGIDHDTVALQLRGIGPAADVSRTVSLDLSRFETKDFEGDFMQKLGLSTLRPKPTIRDIADPTGPAAAAGLQRGDRIVSVDGKAIDDVDGLQRMIAAAPGRRLALTVERNGALLSTAVTPVASGTPGGAGPIGRIGVQLRAQMQTVLVRYGPIDAITHGATQTWDLCVFSLRMIGKMFSGEVSLKNISGPVTIAEYAGQSARLGPLAFISFVAFISISLGVMNLLPIPMLDGGHLLYYSAEIVRGRPPSERFLEWSQRVGMFLLAGLMVVALFNDFARLLS